MESSWWVYTSLSTSRATKAVQTVYTALSAIVGEDLAEHLEPGEDLEPPVLGYWPDIKVATRVMPTSGGVRAHAEAAGKTDARFDDAALARLDACSSAIQVERPQGFDPALITTLRVLLAELGPAIFSKNERSFVTSEALLADLRESRDLAETLRAVAAGELAEDDDIDDVDDRAGTDLGALDEDPEDEETAAAKPEALRQTLMAMAEYPRARKRASAMMGDAPELVAKFVERLARVGPEPDAKVASAFMVQEQDIHAARKTLAGILRRAEAR